MARKLPEKYVSPPFPSPPSLPSPELLTVAFRRPSARHSLQKLLLIAHANSCSSQPRENSAPFMLDSPSMFSFERNPLETYHRLGDFGHPSPTEPETGTEPPLP